MGLYLQYSIQKSSSKPAAVSDFRPAEAGDLKVKKDQFLICYRYDVCIVFRADAACERPSICNNGSHVLIADLSKPPVIPVAVCISVREGLLMTKN